MSTLAKQSIYVTGEYGQDCPLNTIVETASECENAATQLQIRYAGNASQFRIAHELPAGCFSAFDGRRVYFNAVINPVETLPEDDVAGICGGIEFTIYVIIRFTLTTNIKTEYETIIGIYYLQKLGDGVGYQKLEKKSCSEVLRNRYGRVYNLQDAQLDCSADPGCSGLYDTNCDGVNFFLCREGFGYENDESDCIYQKKGSFVTSLKCEIFNRVIKDVFNSLVNRTV